MTDTSITSLTASEMVFLHGEKFASKAGLLNKQKLIHLDQEVSRPELVTSIVAAALLASQDAGAIRLEVRQKKALLGLAKVTTLYAEPLQPIDFPSGSLEAKFFELATEYKLNKDQNEIWRLVYAWLIHDVDSPWSEAIDRIQSGLGKRQLLDVIQEKKLKIFTTTRYELPESTRDLAASQPVEPVQKLLADCRTYHPEVWDLLVKQIKQGIEKRIKHDTTD